MFIPSTTYNKRKHNRTANRLRLLAWLRHYMPKHSAPIKSVNKALNISEKPMYKAWIITVFGLVLQLSGRFLGRLRDFGYIQELPIPEDYRLLLALGGTLILTIGITMICKNKGRKLTWSLLMFIFIHWSYYNFQLRK